MTKMKSKKFSACLVVIAIAAILTVVGQTSRVESQADPLDALVIEFYPLPENQLPLKKIMKHRIKVTNSGPSSLNIAFATELIGPFLQKIDTITPEPSFLWLDPGESEYILTKMDEKWGKIPAFMPWENNELGHYERTYRWTFTDRSTNATRSLDITIPYEVVETKRHVQEVARTDATGRGDGISGPISFEGRVVNELGEPLSGMEVFLTTGHWDTSIPQTDSDGRFRFQNLPSRNDWVIVAQHRGQSLLAPIGNTVLGGDSDPSWQDTRQPRTLQFVNEATNELSLELRYPEAKGEYTLSASKKPDVGYWRGDVDEAESTLLLINGMENWGADYPQQEAKSLLSLFSLSGDLIWSYRMGWEGWGTSLSRDGKYAAFTTSNCSGKASRPVPEGACGKFGVLDAADGSEVWTKEATEVTETTHPKLGSKEVEISSTNEFLAVGGVEGTLLLYELKTGRLLWSSFIRGQVRGILFDETDNYIYAGAGDGYTYKLSVSDGAVIWKTWNGSWPYLGAFKFSKQRDLLGVGGKYGDLAVIDPETGTRLWYKDMDDIVSWLDFSPDGRFLVAGGGGQYATTLFEARTGEKLWHLPYYSHSGMFTSDGNYILAGEVLLDLSGREIGKFLLSTTGCRPGCDGLFTYISDDMTKVIHTRRDMDPGGIGLYFWQGQLRPDDPGVVKSVEGLVDPTVKPDEQAKPGQVPTTPTGPIATGDDSSQTRGCPRLEENAPCFGSEDPKLLECLQTAIGTKRFEEIRAGGGPPPDQRERSAMGSCYQASQGMPTPTQTSVASPTPTLVSTPTPRPMPTPTQTTVPSPTPAPSPTPTLVSTPTPTPAPFPTETPVPTPTSLPLPTSTSVTVASTPPANSGGGGCNAPVDPAGTVDAGWLVLGLFMPGLALRNLIRRNRNRR